MRLTLLSLTAAALLTVGVGGAVVAQVDQAPERSAAPPPSDAEPPPPEEAGAPLANAVTPDEAAPPPEAVPPEEVKPQAPVPAAVAGNVQEEEPPPPPPPPPPLKRPRFATAILQAADKSTSETLRFEAKVGQPIRYKGLTMVVHACETNAEDDIYADSYAHVEVSSQPQTVAGRAAAPPRQVFRGWMVGSSQSLHPLEHPLYDLWLIACKTDAPPAPGSSL